MRDARDIILAPVISEKSYDLINQQKYTFKVDRKATKPEIQQAVERIFNVDVVGVNTINQRGKLRRQGYKSGYRAAWKKAIVTLKEGQKIEIFEGAG